MDLIQQQVVRPIEQAGNLGRLYNIHLAGTADDLTKTYDA